MSLCCEYCGSYDHENHPRCGACGSYDHDDHIVVLLQEDPPMHWVTMRVLAKNLRELFDEMDAGTHMTMQPADPGFGESEPHEVVSEPWEFALVSTATSLAKLLHLADKFPGETGFAWVNRDKIGEAALVRFARTILGLAEKLLADYAAEQPDG